MDQAQKLQILELLESDSRLTPDEIAVMLGLRPEEVKETIGELEANNIILKYNTIIDWEKAGGEKAIALIDVKVTPERDVGFDKVAERIYKFPEVVSVYLMSGTYDLSVIVEGKTLKDVALFVAEKLAPIEQVSSTVTHFVLKKYKEAGVIFSEPEQDRRLMFTP